MAHGCPRLVSVAGKDKDGRRGEWRTKVQNFLFPDRLIVVPVLVLMALLSFSFFAFFRQNISEYFEIFL